MVAFIGYVGDGLKKPGLWYIWDDELIYQSIMCFKGEGNMRVWGKYKDKLLKHYIV